MVRLKVRAALMPVVAAIFGEHSRLGLSARSKAQEGFARRAIRGDKPSLLCSPKIAAVVMMVLLCSCSGMRENDQEEKKQNIKNAKVNVQLGIAYLERKNVNRAKTKLLTALNQAPNIPETWYSMAYFLESTGDKAQAKKYYLKAISLAPERGDVQNNYGTFLCRTGEYKASIQRFMLAVKDPDYLETADAYENAGMCALKIPNKELAYDYFNTAVTRNPSRPIALFNLAKMDYDDGDYKNAKIRLDQYLAISPASPQSSDLMQNINSHIHGTRVESDVAAEEEQPVPIVRPRVTYRRYLQKTKVARLEAAPLHHNKYKIHTSHQHKLSVVHSKRVARVVTKKKHIHALLRTAKPGAPSKKMAARHSHHVEKAYSWRV